MSNKDTEQKYFVGNWMQFENDDDHKIIGFVLRTISFDERLGYTYVVAWIDVDNNPDEDDGYAWQVRNYDNEDLEGVKVIPYPWQLFFKVGDKVKIVGVPNSGIITKISTFAESPKPLYVRTESAGGKEYIDVYAPHELIKIGE